MNANGTMLPLESRVRQEIRRSGPLEAYRRLIAENDAASLRPELDTGRRLASARAAIFTEIVRHWAAGMQQSWNYEKPFAVVALGGTGRAEVSPFSDLDFAFLFDDAIEGNRFLLELQRQVINTDEFEQKHGFTFQPLPFNMDDAPLQTGRQLNSFLDMRALHDPDGLTARFRDRIRATYDPFEHFVHVRSFWCDQLQKPAREVEKLSRFEIKNQGPRVFLAGIWTLAGKEFRPSYDVYPLLDDPRDLEAYDFLLRIRAYIHARNGRRGNPGADGSHPEDVMGFEDFMAFGEMLGPSATERQKFEFGNQVRVKLLAARRRVAQFTHRIIERELREGRAVSSTSDLVLGTGGLRHTRSSQATTPDAKSRAALSLLVASQKHGVPIDPAESLGTFRNIGDWLVPVPELSALFYEQRGSLADSFGFLSQFEGAQERLFPGYEAFEATFDNRVLAERSELRGALERKKIKILEKYVLEGQVLLARIQRRDETLDLASNGVLPEIEAALLDPDHLAAVKLALKTKRLPVTPDDETLRDDETRALHERTASGVSGIPLVDYYEPYRQTAGFTTEAVRVVEFLLRNRRVFKDRAGMGLNPRAQVDAFVELCDRSEQRLRALYVFTCADRYEWESEQKHPQMWFNIRELYGKVMERFRPGFSPTRSLENSGYSPDELRVLKDFGADFFGGSYRRYANHFGSHLLRLTDDPEGHEVGPKASVLRDGMSTIIGVAARDYRGLAAVVCGALWRQNIEIRQAHLFSAMNQGLALDFFHVDPGERPINREILRSIEEAIRDKSHIDETDEVRLPQFSARATLERWQTEHCRLMCETAQETRGLFYALTYVVYRHLHGNIFGLVAYTIRGRAYLSVYLNLPPEISFEQAQEIIALRFG